MSFFRVEYILIKYRDFFSQLPKIHPFAWKTSKAFCKLFTLCLYILFQHTEKHLFKVRISCLLSFFSLPGSQTYAHRPTQSSTLLKWNQFVCYSDARCIRRIMLPRNPGGTAGDVQDLLVQDWIFSLVDLYISKMTWQRNDLFAFPSWAWWVVCLV